MSNFLGLTKKDYNLIKRKGYITTMTKEATPKKKRTTRKTTKPKEENKAAMANTPQPSTSNKDPSHNKTIQVKEKEDKPKEFNLNDYPRYTQTRYNVLLDRYMRQNHLFAEAHSLALRDLKLQKLI